MLTIQNYKLGEGCFFKGWELECVAEFNDVYVFLWNGAQYKKRKRYEVVLSRKSEGPEHKIQIVDVNDSKIIYKWGIPSYQIEEHWKFIEKSIWLMEQTRI
jgi:hypothetical protein